MVDSISLGDNGGFVMGVIVVGLLLGLTDNGVVIWGAGTLDGSKWYGAAF